MCKGEDMPRPTKYSEEIVQKANKYLDEYSALGDVVPMIEGLAIYLGISRDTIYEWTGQGDKKEFSDIVRAVQTSQARQLINGGLKAQLQPTITKLLLSKHGYNNEKAMEFFERRPKPIMPIYAGLSRTENTDDKPT